METDTIIEIGIDNSERLYIRPHNKRFNYIWRSATEVHWDQEKKFLYSPKPREWSYYDWYCHIITVVKSEFGCELIINDETNWFDIPDELKNKISLSHLT